MELPDVGQHCSLPDCNDLDFLPLICNLCQEVFCKLHSSYDSHNCPKWSPSSVDTTTKTFSVAKHCCQLSGCDNSETVEIRCPKCAKNFCMKHRIEADHQCEVRPGDYMPKTAQLVSQILAGKAKPPDHQPKAASGAKSVKSQKTQAKVHLMKIKGKAVGDKSVALPDRVYFQVILPGGSGDKSVFVSKKWSLGKAVDNMAEHCRVATKRGLDKLQVLRKSDNLPVNGGKLDTTVEQLVTDEKLFSGDVLVFTYANS